MLLLFTSLLKLNFQWINKIHEIDSCMVSVSLFNINLSVQNGCVIQLRDDSTSCLHAFFSIPHLCVRMILCMFLYEIWQKLRHGSEFRILLKRLCMCHEPSLFQTSILLKILSLCRILYNCLPRELFPEYYVIFMALSVTLNV